MGKGEIISHIGDGQYSVKLLYDHRRSDTMIEAIDEQVLSLDARIAELEDGSQKSLLKLQKAALLKRKEYLQDNIVEDWTTTAWCADLTEDLAGHVGTIEINGERTAGVQIQPGHEGNAAYDADRDGQLQSTAAGHPSAVYYNLAMLPGWQKWMPTYRYGTITAIDTGSDTCSVTLNPALSSAQSLNINLETALTNVSIEYMNCNGAAFEVGDHVVVQFTPVKGQTDTNWNTAKVIGFREEPRACEYRFFIKPTFNGLTATKGSESLRLEYTFDGTDYQLNGNVHGTRYDPGSYFLAGHAGPFELADPNHSEAEITAKVGTTYSPGTGYNNLFLAYYLVTIDDDYDIFREYEGVMYYFKQVLWRPSSSKVFDGAKTTVTVDGEDFDCYEVPFTSLNCTWRLPDDTAQTLWPKRYYDVSTCSFVFEDNPAALGTVWSRVSPYYGAPAVYDYSTKKQWVHEIYITTRDPGWLRRSPTINYEPGAGSPGYLLTWDVGHCYGQPPEDTYSQWIVDFRPPNNVGGSFDPGLPTPFTLDHACILTDDADGNNPQFTDFVSRQRYWLHAQVHSLELGSLYHDVQQYTAEWSYEMHEQDDF